MAKAGTTAHIMSLAVDLDEHHAFITSTPPDIVAKVFEAVHTLSLTNSHCPFWIGGGSRHEPRTAITKTLFPSLEVLTIDHAGYCHMGYVPVATISSESDRPAISKLMIMNVNAEEPTFHTFLRSYGSTVRHLIIDSIEDLDYGPDLDIAKDLALDTPNICMRE